MTKIEWAEESWNPIVGCTKVSPGCQNCYAEKMAGRLAGMGQKSYMEVVEWDDHPEDTRPMQQWNGKTHLVESALKKPLHWKKPRTIFACSMGDLFHESVPFEWIDEVMDIITRCQHHTFLILTKRPEIMSEYISKYKDYSFQFYNVWLEVTAENQEQADKRIPILLGIQAAKRVVSIEPMLGPVDFAKVPMMRSTKLDIIMQRTSLDWVICGSESGSGRRECDEDWVRSLRDQCVNANVPFFLKQLHRGGKKIALPDLDGKEWRERP